jgi:uncharacterized coiled-coil protein SlyX
MEQEPHETTKIFELEFELVRQHRMLTSLSKRCSDHQSAICEIAQSITDLRGLFITVGEEVQALKLQLRELTDDTKTT